MSFEGIITTQSDRSSRERLHRADCGHGKRALSTGHAVRVDGPVARIVLRAVQEGADPELDYCLHCRPHTKGLLP